MALSTVTQVQPRVLILGDDTVQVALPKVRVEHILGQPINFTHCTQFTVLVDELSKVSSHIKVVVISCMSNIIGKLVTSQDVKTAIERGMGMLGRVIEDVYQPRNGSLKIFIAPCTPRNFKDFSTHNKFAMRCLGDAVKGLQFVSVLTWSNKYDVKTDNVTLADHSCKQYLEDMLNVVRHGLERPRTSSVSSISSNPPIDTSTPRRDRLGSIQEDIRKMLDEDDETMTDDEVFRSVDSLISKENSTVVATPSISNALSRLEARLSKLEKHGATVDTRLDATDNKLTHLSDTYVKNRALDIFTFADQIERMDYATNLSRKECIMLTGLKAPDFPKELAEQNAKVVEIVRELIKKVLNREEPFTVTVRKSTQRRYARDSSSIMIPPVEVKLTSLAAAQEFRSKGVALARAKTDGFANVYFGTSTTVSTRIRTEIMKSLAKVLSSKDTQTDAYCITNSTRPILSVGPKGSKGGRKTYLFAESIKRFPEEICQADLSEAYKRAFPMFKGRMEHTFIVLKEIESMPVPTGSNNVPLGSKRPLDEPAGSGSSNKRQIPINID